MVKMTENAVYNRKDTRVASRLGKTAESQPSRSFAPVQAKLETTAPGDSLEMEADRMADYVTGKSMAPASGGDKPAGAPSISAYGGTSVSIPPKMESQLSAAQGGGQPMPSGLMAQMESSFGHDFSNVRIHTDDAAAQMSDSINAKAFTSGNDIYFNQGQFRPETSAGQHLIAHELTHTIQQSGRIAREPKEKSAGNSQSQKRTDKYPDPWARLQQNIEQEKKYKKLLHDEADSYSHKADRVIDKVENQLKLNDDAAWYVYVSLGLFYRKNDFYRFISALRRSKADLDKCKTEDNIAFLPYRILKNARFIDMVNTWMDYYREDKISFAGSWITGLTWTKTIAFSLAGAMAGVAFAPAAAAAMGGGALANITASVAIGEIAGGALGLADGIASESSKAFYDVGDGHAIENIGVSTAKGVISGAAGGLVGGSLGLYAKVWNPFAMSGGGWETAANVIWNNNLAIGMTLGLDKIVEGDLNSYRNMEKSPQVDLDKLIAESESIKTPDDLLDAILDFIENQQ